MRPLIVLLLTLWAGAGCRHLSDPTAIADAQLAARVRTAIVNDPELGLRAVEIEVRQGVVHVAGRVGSPDEAARLESLVRSVPGVAAVELAVQIGSAPAPPARSRRPATGTDALDRPADPRLLAVGVSLSRTAPRQRALAPRVALGPLVRIGAARGFTATIDFNWFAANLHGRDGDTSPIARIRFRPVMGGVGYTIRGEHAALTVSLAGGVSFNSLRLAEPVAPPAALPVQVDPSPVWRPGATVWIEAGRRGAVSAFAGYLVTRPGVAWLEDGRLVHRRLRADTVVVSAGFAYKLF